MAKKAPETVEEAMEWKPAQSVDAVDAGAARERELEVCAQRDKSGFYCYIGPSLKGLIQHGTIYRGTREDALARAAKAIAALPPVKTLIVAGDALPEARIRVKTPGNVLYVSYQRLACPLHASVGERTGQKSGGKEGN